MSITVVYSSSRGLFRSFLHWYRLNMRFRGTWGLGTLLFLGFIVFGAFMMANTIVFGSPNTFAAPPTSQERRKEKDNCEHTQQGKHYITDDKGGVCKWKDLNPVTSCCKDYSITKIHPFSCENCNRTIACCSVYEFCVSCCLDPAKEDLRNEVQQVLDAKSLGVEDFSSLSPFEYCRAICRTSSKSIYSQNQYRNDDKYCYSLDAPPLQNKTQETEMNPNRIKIAERTTEEVIDINVPQQNEPIQEVEVVKETPLDETILITSNGMNVGDGERKEQIKNLNNLFGVFTSDSSSMEVAHWLRLCMLAFLLYFTCMPYVVDKLKKE